MIKILLDGWSLVYRPDSTSALHLMTLINNPPPGVDYAVALPGTKPEWLPQNLQVYEMRVANNEWGQLLWEQRVLPGAAKRSGADLLHLTTPTPPLASTSPVVLSPSELFQRRSGGVVNRLRSALASGGMSRLDAIFWPGDLPPPRNLEIRVYTLPPIVLGRFLAAEDVTGDLLDGFDLPETYILYHGAIDRATTSRLLDVWSWAGGSIGEYYPLLIAGLTDSPSKSLIEQMQIKLGATSSIRVLPPLNPLSLVRVYHYSTAVFYLGSTPAWGNAARNALASAKPFVAASSTEIEAIVGPAAYLLPEGSARTLGAALIAVVVEDSLAEELSNAARERSSVWDTSEFRDAIGEAYENISQ